jgi:predicted nucleic acid-binding protein
VHYIVDASVVIEYFVTGPFTQHAIAFFDQTTAQDVLTVPEFCLLECTNVIWKQVRFNGLPHQDAEDMVQTLSFLKLRRVPVKALLKQALTIALKHQLAVYDSSYIALAQHYRTSFITIDVRQQQVAIAEQVLIKPLTDFKP